ncbi:phosphoribosylformylglycinamidine synthase subunit PurL [Lignipirellula cremea]|uniref:Phosphoribosylformylglycinamidine synthase subunit PurL n=1 Tax=Lignipirellula cremea TaxID=2528010 RepID=A0A518DYP7_9BACT|nr:phosphoribosylformylglycinamidine synthase subunit PurL [Lignipirellula cremea]QDU96966.1 Phosphoribosylformylglycinamidine synthase subunit PurL [Lignipirellula cremea]
MTLWEVDIYPGEGRPDRAADALRAEARDLGVTADFQVTAGHGYLVQGTLDRAGVERLSRELLGDVVVEQPLAGAVGDEVFSQPPARFGSTNGAVVVHVLPKPGVTDAVAESVVRAIADMAADDPSLQTDSVRTFRKYWFAGLPHEQVRLLTTKLLANDSIEVVIEGPLALTELHVGSPYDFQPVQVPLREASDDELQSISRQGLLSLTLIEMQTVQQHFEQLGRDPTDIELETIAQTWSEHCSHKTLAGRITYVDAQGERQFENMLKETIFAATQTVRKQLGDDDWCVSVFQDNAGIVRFDEEHNVAFKVETHNRPSALEPYGGANTGIGGVIRDTLGTGLGAKPVCNTDVFCFAPPATPHGELPPGVLHPRRVMQGVVGGVRDYGNRMGIPTVNGAVYFDRRYLGNPLVFCGDVGVLPRDKSFKEVQPNDLIVTLGGRTGRDGIHGATFSSIELTSESETTSGGAVQIGNAITEKMVLDVLLEARDRGLYTAVTDCGAGGFSSAVGEMGEKIGAEVWLDKAPLKYAGLSYTEIWISEAQERMVCSVPDEHWEELRSLCEAEGVEATAIGRFTPTGQLTLLYQDQKVGEVSMEFLHDGRPPVVRQATWQAPAPVPFAWPAELDAGAALLKILGSLNVCSKEWIIRQYDHEVQGGSVLKPLVGVANDGPGDAAVIRPVLSSQRGLAVSCGMNPHYGDLDPGAMAASGIDEAIRNCVAVGADPARIALLDNFCWGYTDRPETLGSLVRAALACQEAAIALQAPFISGKDSLNNEFSYEVAGQRRTISIPATLLISALGQVNDVKRCVSMDFKQAGNLLYLVGLTRDELGGSHLGLVENATGGTAPSVDYGVSPRVFAAIHQAIEAGLIAACHDLSEGGLAAAAAEMALAGGLGAQITQLENAPWSGSPHDSPLRQSQALLFSESNTRFLCEVRPEHQSAWESLLADVAWGRIGTVVETDRVQAHGLDGSLLLDVPLAELKDAWQKPLQW